MKALRTLCIALIALMLCMMVTVLGLHMFSNVLVDLKYSGQAFVFSGCFIAVIIIGLINHDYT